MAVSKSPTQITFSGANSILVSGDSQVTSDNMAFSSNSVAAQITLYADHSGTPVTGDTVDFYILYSTGDPDGSGTATYDTPGHGLHLTNLDLNTDDPAQRTVEVSACAANFQIYIDNNAASNGITCASEFYEILVS